jgi:hypothetical protein
MECSTLTLFWVLIGVSATVVISKFASPRLGRHAFSCVGLGCAMLQLIAFFHRYLNCNWNFFVCDHNVLQILSSIPEDTAQKMAAFNSIYRLCAQMMLYLFGVYSIEFKQHLAWNTICLLFAHYCMFALIINLYFDASVTVSAFGVLGFLALVSATELIYRAGRRKAQALVLQDSTSRQVLWSDLIHSNPDFKQQITRLQSTINSGSLAAVSERLDPKTNKLVPQTVLQAHADIDQLYRDCSVLNYFFQDWVRTWFPSGTRSHEFELCNPRAPYRDAFVIRVANCFPDIIRGPIKAPNRVISKVFFVINFSFAL